MRFSLTFCAAALLGLAACAQGDLPQAPPPADAVPSPQLFTLSPGTPADGTLRVTLRRGVPAARGTLRTNGQTVPVTVSGLAVQGAMPARLELTGQVYGLPQRGAIAGIYRDVGNAASDLDAALRIGNDNLVLVVLRTGRPDIALTVPPDGVTVALQP